MQMDANCWRLPSPSSLPPLSLHTAPPYPLHPHPCLCVLTMVMPPMRTHPWRSVRQQQPSTSHMVPRPQASLAGPSLTQLRLAQGTQAARRRRWRWRWWWRRPGLGITKPWRRAWRVSRRWRNHQVTEGLMWRKKFRVWRIIWFFTRRSQSPKPPSSYWRSHAKKQLRFCCFSLSIFNKVSCSLKSPSV